MSTTTKAPDKQLADLQAERDRVEREEGELGRAVGELRGALELVPDRLRDVALADIRGAKAAETVEQIEVDRYEKQAEIAAKNTRVEASLEALKQIREEMDRIGAEHVGFFTKKAVAASERARAASDEAEAAIRAAHAASRAAQEAWVIPRKVARDSGHKMPDELLRDFDHVLSSLRSVVRGDPFWPGNRRDSFDAWVAQHGHVIGLATEEGT
jgi:sugar phosphate isomerase/epimerase